MESTTLFTLMNREVKTNRARTFLKCTGECSFFAYAYSLSVLLSALATCIHLLMVIKVSLNKKKEFFSKTGRKIPSLFNCSIPLAFLNQAIVHFSLEIGRSTTVNELTHAGHTGQWRYRQDSR